MRYIVTGGAGFVGSHLVEQLIEKQHDVIVIDNLSKGKKENLSKVIDRIKFLDLDIRDYTSMEQNIRNVDGIFHQAALTVVQDSFKHPEEYNQVNVEGTENIFRLANENNIKVVFASSSSVYGHQKNMPISENAEKNPINPYGKTKLDDEILMEKYVKLGAKIIGLRYFNIFGKGQTKEYAGVITKFFDRISNGEPPIIYGDGLQIRDFIFVGDIVKANMEAMLNDTSNFIVNVGSGKAITILELAEMMIRISKSDLKPVFKDPLEGDIQKSHADTSLINQKLGWRIEVELEDWLKNNMFNNEIDKN